MARVTKEMTMGELLQTYYEQCPEIVDVLTGLGMHCIGCPSSIGESLADAAYAVSYTHLKQSERKTFRLFFVYVEKLVSCVYESSPEAITDGRESYH